MICLSGVMGSGLGLSKLPSGRGGKQAALWKSSSFCVFISLDAIEIILHLSLLWGKKKKNQPCNLLSETKEQIEGIEREDGPIGVKTRHQRTQTEEEVGERTVSQV